MYYVELEVSTTVGPAHILTLQTRNKHSNTTCRFPVTKIWSDSRSYSTEFFDEEIPHYVITSRVSLE